MMGAVFLSAGVPDPKRNPHYIETADISAIQAAIVGFIGAILGRKLIVWGGQPGITPMFWAASQSAKVDYSKWVRLYQSQFFAEKFPEEVKYFNPQDIVPAVNNDRDQSLKAMRTAMLTDQKPGAAVFIGGMEGVWDEYMMVKELHPDTIILPIASTGGAALDIYNDLKLDDPELIGNLTYLSLFRSRIST